MMKVVLNLEIFDDESKIKAMKTVSGHSGIESISLDMKDKKLTVTGVIDPVKVVVKLRKLCPTDIITVGPAKEPEKKKEEAKKKDAKDDAAIKAQQAYYYCPLPHYHYPTTVPPCYHHSYVEEDPNACPIC